MNRATHAAILAIAIPMLPRLASAQTVPPPFAWQEEQRPYRIELTAPPGVELKIRPIADATEWQPLICPPTCTLSVYPGRYRIESEAPPESGLRKDLWRRSAPNAPLSSSQVDIGWRF